MNAILFEDKKYDNIVDETITEMETLSNTTPREKWEIFMMTMKTKSMCYSTARNFSKRKLKNKLIKQIEKIEEEENQAVLAEYYAYLKD